MAANLELVIKAQDQASGVLKDINKHAGGLNSALGTVAKVGAVAAVAGIGALAFAGVKAAQSLARIEQIGAQTDAAIASTGGVAGVTRKQIDDLAGTLENLTSVEAETITKGQNLLLTFTNIRNRVGDGNDIFDQATEAMVNMSVAMGQDVSQTAIQVGKALNDPVLGVTALRRVGVQLSEQQEKQIKDFVAVNDIASAQKVILGELETQFGGSAEALGKTFGGQLKIVQHQLGTIAETITAAVMPAFVFLTTKANEGLQAAIPIVTTFVDRLILLGKAFVAAASGEGVTSSGLFGFFERLGVIVHDDVLPVVKSLADTFKNDIVPAIKDFISNKANIVALGGAIAALFTAWAITAGIAAVATIAAAAPIYALILAIAALGAAFAIIEMKTGVFSKAFTTLKPHVLELGAILKNILTMAIKNFIIPALITLKQGWDDLWPILRQHVIPVLKEIGKFLLEHKPIIIGVVAALILLNAPWLAVVAVLIIVLAKWDEIKEMLTVTIPDAINSVIDTIKGIPIIGEIFEGTLKAVAIMVETYFKLIMIQVETAIKAIRAIIEIVLGLIHGDFGRVWQGIKDLVGALLGGLVAQASVWMDALKNLVFIALQTLVGIWRDQFVLARDAALGILGGLPGQIAGVAVDVFNAARSLGEGVPRAIADGVRHTASWLKAPINQLIGFFESAINFIIRAINKFNPASMIGGAFNTISGFFGGPQLPTFNLQPVSLDRLHQGTSFWRGGPAIMSNEELAVLPRGSRVLSPTATAAAMGGGVTLNAYINVNTLTGNIPPAQQMQLEEWLRGVMRRISR